MVRTKSLSDPIKSSDGERILVTRLWPMYRSREKLSLSEEFGWIKELAPSRELLKDWKAHRISWEEYVSRYHAEMEEREGLISKVAKVAKARTITLLCFEQEGDPHCHRHLLKKMIEDAMKA